MGITTGEAFCGVVGSKTRKEYTILVSFWYKCARAALRGMKTYLLVLSRVDVHEKWEADRG